MLRIIPVSDHPAVHFAASELKKYLRMLLPEGGDVAVAAGGEGFRVGLTRDLHIDDREAADPALDDLIVIRTDACGGVIAGTNPGAVLIAVYRYLRLCGCRFLFPGVDGEYVPVLAELPPVSFRKLADHRFRGQCNEGAESQQAMLDTIDFSPKIGLNTYMMEFDVPFHYYDEYYSHAMNTRRPPEPVDKPTVLQWKRQCEAEIARRGLRFHDMGHGWTAEPFGLDSSSGWTPGDEDVPEAARPFIAQVDGRRCFHGGVALNTNICFSNSEGRRIVARYVTDYARRHQNVDFLHVWLADDNLNHCECPACRARSVSDWYVTLLNDIDEELTRAQLPTRIVFILYYETRWAPGEARLRNPSRFTMLFAPLGRSYMSGYAQPADPGAMQPFVLNRVRPPRNMGACLAHLDTWRQIFPGDAFAYEYHFWFSQYRDFGAVRHARLIYDDVRGLKRHGLSGIVEDGSQRSFFPSGFCYYVYAETLFDASVSFDALAEDYFSHAYGPDWRKVWDYLDGLSQRMPAAYFEGSLSADEARGLLYNPAVAEKLDTVREWTEAFRPVLRAHRVQSVRARTVCWRLLAHHADLACRFAEAAAQTARGGDGSPALRALMDGFSEREIYLERYFDHCLFWRSWQHLYALNAPAPAWPDTPR